MECAKVAWHLKNTYFSAQYARITARRDHNRANVAVAHAILKAAYHILKNNTPYQELGPDYFDQRTKAIRPILQVKHLILQNYFKSLHLEDLACNSELSFCGSRWSA